METCKRVILCADDYGQKNSVSQAIVQLLMAKRLSAVSCMVTQSDWPEQWAALQPFERQVDVGLHFNLTEGVALSEALHKGQGMLPLGRLLGRALLGRIDRDAVAAELNAQLDAFSAATGRMPDFIDGHQHIQHFAGVREALIQVYVKRLQGTGCYIRCVDDPAARWGWEGPARFKRFVLQWSGAGLFKRLLAQHAIPHNQSFKGVYPFQKATRYAAYFPRFLSAISEGGLILCHPGTDARDAADPIAAARVEEFRFFSGPAFSDACQKAGVRISRFSEIYPAF